MSATDTLGEPIYAAKLKFVDTVERGASLQSMFAGDLAFPLSAFRVDFVFEGRIQRRVAGEIRGVDYALLRPDGDREHASVRALWLG